MLLDLKLTFLKLVSINLKTLLCLLEAVTIQKWDVKLFGHYTTYTAACLCGDRRRSPSMCPPQWKTALVTTSLTAVSLWCLTRRPVRASCLLYLSCSSRGEPWPWTIFVIVTRIPHHRRSSRPCYWNGRLGEIALYFHHVNATCVARTP